MGAQVANRRLSPTSATTLLCQVDLVEADPQGTEGVAWRATGLLASRVQHR